MKTSTERRKAKKNTSFLCIKSQKKFFLVFKPSFVQKNSQKKFFLVFLLSVEVLPEADTKEF
jgi:hypothetical protein